MSPRVRKRTGVAPLGLVGLGGHSLSAGAAQAM